MAVGGGCDGVVVMITMGIFVVMVAEVLIEWVKVAVVVML